MPADWCPACGPHFIGRCPHVPIDPAEVRRKVLAVLAHENPAYRESLGACPAGHPAACITSSREGTCSCAWCDEVAKLRADIEAANAALAESQALLALWSGGRAGRVPEGAWRNETYRLQGDDDFAPRRHRFVKWGGGVQVTVEADGSWHGWTSKEIGGEHPDMPGPRPVLQACAEAEAWLKAQEVERG